jgi:hypothetical protein
MEVARLPPHHLVAPESFGLVVASVPGLEEAA